MPRAPCAACAAVPVSSASAGSSPSVAPRVSDYQPSLDRGNRARGLLLAGGRLVWSTRVSRSTSAAGGARLVVGWAIGSSARTSVVADRRWPRPMRRGRGDRSRGRPPTIAGTLRSFAVEICTSKGAERVFWFARSVSNRASVIHELQAPCRPLDVASRILKFRQCLVFKPGRPTGIEPRCSPRPGRSKTRTCFFGH